MKKKFRKKYWCLIGCALLVHIAAGCASGGSTVPAASCPAPAGQSSEYIIGPGDALRVVVWRNDELSATLPVRPDGRVSTPLIDDMQAAGKTPSQLADALFTSEDSETINTSFVERLNLTIRQSLAYLQRRSPAHARCKERLSKHVALIQCHYTVLIMNVFAPIKACALVASAGHRLCRLGS